jgi:hypothetical protein
MRLRLTRLNESFAPTNSIGLSSAVHGTGAIDTFDPAVGKSKSKLVRRATARAKARFRSKLHEAKYLKWTGKKFESIPPAHKLVKLGGVTKLLINPSMNQTQNQVGDTNKDIEDGKARNASTVKESVVNSKRKQIRAILLARRKHSPAHTLSLTKMKRAMRRAFYRPRNEGFSLTGRLVGAAVGGLIGTALRRHFSSNSKPPTRGTKLGVPPVKNVETPSRFNPLSGPWGSRVQDPANATGPKLQQGSSHQPTRLKRSRSSPPSSSSLSPNNGSGHMSRNDFRDMLAKNPATKISAGKR